jgi:hypothetical protein
LNKKTFSDLRAHECTSKKQVIESRGLATDIAEWMGKYNEVSLNLPAANRILRGEEEQD